MFRFVHPTLVLLLKLYDTDTMVILIEFTPYMRQSHFSMSFIWNFKYRILLIGVKLDSLLESCIHHFYNYWPEGEGEVFSALKHIF